MKRLTLTKIIGICAVALSACSSAEVKQERVSWSQLSEQQKYALFADPNVTDRGQLSYGDLEFHEPVVAMVMSHPGEIGLNPDPDGKSIEVRLGHEGEEIDPDETFLGVELADGSLIRFGDPALLLE